MKVLKATQRKMTKSEDDNYFAVVSLLKEVSEFVKRLEDLPQKIIAEIEKLDELEKSAVRNKRKRALKNSEEN